MRSSTADATETLIPPRKLVPGAGAGVLPRGRVRRGDTRRVRIRKVVLDAGERFRKTKAAKSAKNGRGLGRHAGHGVVVDPPGRCAGRRRCQRWSTVDHGRHSRSSTCDQYPSCLVGYSGIVLLPCPPHPNRRRALLVVLVPEPGERRRSTDGRLGGRRDGSARRRSRLGLGARPADLWLPRSSGQRPAVQPARPVRSRRSSLPDSRSSRSSCPACPSGSPRRSVSPSP